MNWWLPTKLQQQPRLGTVQFQSDLNSLARLILVSSCRNRGRDPFFFLLSSASGFVQSTLRSAPHFQPSAKAEEVGDMLEEPNAFSTPPRIKVTWTEGRRVDVHSG